MHSGEAAKTNFSLWFDPAGASMIKIKDISWYTIFLYFNIYHLPAMLYVYCLWVFNATFKNISAMSRRSVLLVEYLEKTTDISQVLIV